MSGAVVPLGGRRVRELASGLHTAGPGRSLTQKLVTLE